MSHRLKIIYGLAVISILVAMIHIFSAYSDNIINYSWEEGRRWLEDTLLTDAYPTHKDLFPFDSSDYWGIALVFLGLVIAASGGIGGGGILVPLFILVFGFSPKHAIPLSNFTIVGSSITNMILNIPKRHPHADRPLVDWDLIMIMEPVTMIGAIVGAFMSKILPDWILVISLVFLLAYTTQTTIEKGMSQFRKETKYFEDLQKSQLSRAIEDESELEESTSLLPADRGQQSNKDDIKKAIPVDSNAFKYEPDDSYNSDSHELSSLLESEKSTPWDRVNTISFMVAVVVFLNILKGGGRSAHAAQSPIGIECGSFTYWLVTVLMIAFILSISIWMRAVLLSKWQLKKRLNYRYCEGDVEWNPTNTIKYPCICFVAGFCAGLFGIGGGIVKGPLMLQMGVNPLVASATVAVMIMYTSVAATTMYVAFGTLTWDYAVFMFILGLVSTVIGQFGVSYLVEKYKRVSLVSLSIGAVVALSTLLMGIQSVFSLTDSTAMDESSTLCGN